MNPGDAMPPRRGPTHTYSRGDVLLGKYRILDVAGRGGMATIYRALHVELDDIVALKVLHNTPDLEYSLRLLRAEAQMLRKISGRCDFVPMIHDTFVTKEGFLVYVMEFLHGKNVREIMDKLRAQGKIMQLSSALAIVKKTKK
jgi:serine/threonine protein kinase